MLKRIPFQWEGNPLYPLPADYDSLTVAGQREARVNACRQWLLEPEDMPTHHTFSRLDLVGDAAVGSDWFFDRYYLHPDPEHNFDPFFYDIPPIPGADFHLDLIRIWRMYRMSLSIAPRGGAKTTVLKRDILKRAVTAPNYSQTYITLVHTTAEKRTGEVRDQCYNNPRINDDFGPEYGGPLRPGRSDAQQGAGLFFLRNRSSLQAASSEGRHRGMRPRKIRLDDPEHDERVSTSMSNVRAYMDRLVNRVILPMVTQSGRGFDWTATHVSKRHYSWHAMSMVQAPDGALVPKDPRFSNWARYHIKMLRDNPETGKPESCWPHNWPLDDAEKKRLNLPADAMTVGDVRRAMGEQAWLAEAQGAPGDSDIRCFPFVNENHDKFFFSFSGAAAEDEDILRSPGSFHLHLPSEGALEPVALPLPTLVRRARLFACVDYSYTNNAASDYKACAVMLHDPVTNQLFVLDGWAAQCSKDRALREVLTLCARWRVPILYPEVVKGSITFYNDLVDIIRTKGPEHLGLTYLPAVKPLKPGMEEKVEKIASLVFRFEHGLIKFPDWAKDRPFFRMLFDQLEGFNPEVPDGGLEHDDCADVVAMSKLVIKSRLAGEGPPPVELSVLERLKRGDLYADAGHTARPLGLGVDILNTPVSQLLDVIDSRTTERPNGPTRI